MRFLLKNWTEICIRIVAIVLTFITVQHPVIASSIDSIILYPVPLDPEKQTLTIEDRKKEYSGKSILVHLQVYDINGDLLFSRNYNSLPVYWKGYSTSGKKVSNGVYIVKLTIEDLDSGLTGKKLFRIIVKK